MSHRQYPSDGTAHSVIRGLVPRIHRELQRVLNSII